MISIQSSELKKYFPLLLDICPKVENRLYRAPAGILLDSTQKEGVTVMAALDGYRALHCEVPSYIDISCEPVIVPRFVIKQIYDIIKTSKTNESVILEIMDTQLIFRYNGHTIYYPLLNCAFPNYLPRLKQESTLIDCKTPVFINPHYLAHLGKWKSECIEMRVINAKTPIFFRSDDYTGMMYVIMPIRLDDGDDDEKGDK